MQSHATYQAHGVFTHAELVAAGYSAWQIRNADTQLGLRRERLGVYVNDRVDVDPWLRKAAVLVAAAGTDAALCRQAAAAIYRLDGFDWGRVPLTVAANRGALRRNPGYRRRSTLEPVNNDLELPLTGPGQTMLELAAELAPRPGCAAARDVLCAEDLVELALETALRNRLVTLEQLDDLIDATGRRWPGRPVLRAVLARRPDGAEPTESYLETRGIQVLRDGGLDGFERQRELRDRGSFLGRVDLFVEPRMVIEFDGRESHESAP